MHQKVTSQMPTLAACSPQRQEVHECVVLDCFADGGSEGTVAVGEGARVEAVGEGGEVAAVQELRVG